VASERLDIECQLISRAREIFAGNIKALANAEATAGIGCDEIRQKYLSLGLKNKVALVTGASRGIGEATAKLLAMQGCRVVVNYRKGQADAEKIVADIVRNGGQAMAFGADISDEKQVQSMITATQEKWGSIDILVNNAVRDFQSKPLLETDWSDYLGELDVSLKGLHNVCKAVIPSMRESGAGKIVNLASILTEMPIVVQNKYITIKNAIIGFTRSLAVELLQDGIQVNALLPNMTETSLLSHISRAYLEKIGSERGFGRNLQPIEVAQNIVYLVSDWSTPMTGQRVILNLGEAPYL
jgi:3-oxoacyl-[acyl-carrier protein] reductase